eukprot:1158545-Pelagomonas_calceolata.AAC.4
MRGNWDSSAGTVCPKKVAPVDSGNKHRNAANMTRVFQLHKQCSRMRVVLSSDAWESVDDHLLSFGTGHRKEASKEGGKAQIVKHVGNCTG